MKRVIIIQARMTSTRLPGKVLMDISGTPMLLHQIRRLTHCQTIDQIMIATTVNTTDDQIVELARLEGVDCFRGSEHDVLSRYVGATCKAQADVVARITADCPLIDPEIVDKAVNDLVNHSAECDFVSNGMPRTFPRGLDVEVFFKDVLMRFDRLGKSKASREHVTLLFFERPELFLGRNIVDDQDNSDLRWTVDTESDLQLVRLLYEALDLGERMLKYKEVLRYVRQHPELILINAGVKTWDPTEKNN
jgi:spore coat polysaccharide biosynthesis protein SpsF